MTNHEQTVWDVCEAYTRAKHPERILDTPLLLRRLIEEIGELAECIALPERQEALESEIGDVYNTLVMLARINGISVERASQNKLAVLKDRTARLRKGERF
jgi:NTP pyrophosphatase (non-canonical NTP hydrolase)